MENKLEKISQNSFMDNFVKTDDILKDICGITESLQKVAYRTVNTTHTGEYPKVCVNLQTDVR